MVSPLKAHAFELLTAPSQSPKVFTLRGVPWGAGNSPVQDLTTLKDVQSPPPHNILSLDPPK
jgi:hypothetical protein